MSITSNLSNFLNANTISGQKRIAQQNGQSQSNAKSAPTAVSNATVSKGAKTAHANLIGVQDILKRMPTLSPERAKEIAEQLSLRVHEQTPTTPKRPQSLAQYRTQALNDMFNTADLKAVAKKLSNAVSKMDNLAQARMAELATEFRVIQTQIVTQAKEMVKSSPKNDWERVTLAEKKNSLMDLIAQSENTRLNAVKKMSEMAKYGPQKPDVYEKLYGNFGGQDTAFSDKVQQIASRIRHQQMH